MSSKHQLFVDGVPRGTPYKMDDCENNLTQPTQVAFMARARVLTMSLSCAWHASLSRFQIIVGRVRRYIASPLLFPNTGGETTCLSDHLLRTSLTEQANGLAILAVHPSLHVVRVSHFESCAISIP